MYLHRKDNYSQYLIDLMDKDRLASGDQKLIDSRIHEHQQEIDRLKELKKAPQVNAKECKEFLEYWLTKFNEHDKDGKASDSQNLFWIRDKIMPAARSRGFRLNDKRILEMFKAGRIDAG